MLESVGQLTHCKENVLFTRSRVQIYYLISDDRPAETEQQLKGL